MTEVTAVPASLTRELVTRLAFLDGLPAAAVALALRDLGFGSRTSLIVHRIIDPARMDGRDPAADVLTPYGRKVVAACAASLHRRGAATMPIGAVARFDGPVPSHADVLRHIASRLRLVPRFTRLADGRPCDFELGHHVHVVSASDLEGLAGKIFAEPWDPARPPWGVWVVDGIPGGGFAVISKADPVLIEHLGGAELLNALYDMTERPNVPLSRLPGRDALGAPEAFGFDELMEMKRALADAGIERAPLSPFDVPLSSTRRIAFVSVPLTDAAKDRIGYRTNEILLAAAAGAVRTWLDRGGHEVDAPLRGALVSITGADGEPALEDRLRLRLVDLPVDEGDAAARLRAVRRREDLLERLPSARALSFRQTQAFLRQRFYNVLVARYPVTSLPMYFMGRTMRALHPIAFLGGKHALALAGIRYQDRLHVGVIGDGVVMHELDGFAQALEAELLELIQPARTNAERESRAR